MVHQELSQQMPRPLLVVLSLFDDPRYVQEATECGAAAYVLKQSAPAFLVTAIRDALAGRFFCTPAISGQALAEIASRFRNPPWNHPGLLTDDERTVLELLGSGCAPEEIARRIAPQPLPVPSVCQSLVRKLGLGDEADLRRYAANWSAAKH